MRTVEMAPYKLNPFLDTSAALSLPEWYVWVDGSDPVGPVSVNQIARGIRAGKVPDDACVARSGSRFWQEVLDTEAVITALKAL
jgi:hypothetical protein